MRLAHGLALGLGQAIGELAQVLRRAVLLAIPAAIERRVAQAEIGRQVDHARRGLQVALDLLLRLAMRQGQKEHVTGRQRRLADKLQLGALAQIGVLLMNVFAGVALGRGLGNLHARMEEQQPQELAAGVAGGAHDAHPQRRAPAGGRRHAGTPAATPLPGRSGSATARVYSTTLPGISTPVAGTEEWNSMVWLTSLTVRPRSGSSNRSIASTPPPTALAAARQMAFSSGVTGQFVPTPPRAVFVIQCGDVR